MQQYAAAQASALLGRLAYQARRVAKSPTADAVHDLRVAMRRFSQCLRCFRTLLPKGRARKIRKRMKQLRRYTAEVRDRDIAIDLLERVGAPSPAIARLAQQRKRANRQMQAVIAQWRKREFSRQWRKKLEL